jgi:D-arabinose 1-dehydrogenase-like Zn-dependent alcohol dehydrogenase
MGNSFKAYAAISQGQPLRPFEFDAGEWRPDQVEVTMEYGGICHSDGQRHGGFANRVRAQWPWVFPLPDKLDPAKAGPLSCGGISVFNPILQANVKATERVGVIGIGGWGHMALGFLSKWGCEVYAFTSSDSKREEAQRPVSPGL